MIRKHTVFYEAHSSNSFIISLSSSFAFDRPTKKSKSKHNLIEKYVYIFYINTFTVKYSMVDSNIIYTVFDFCLTYLLYCYHTHINIFSNALLVSGVISLS